MPIFEYKGKDYEVSDEHAKSFAQEYPDASIIMRRGGDEYRVKLNDYDSFISEMPTQTKDDTPDFRSYTSSQPKPEDTTAQVLTQPKQEAQEQSPGAMSAQMPVGQTAEPSATVKAPEDILLSGQLRRARTKLDELQAKRNQRASEVHKEATEFNKKNLNTLGRLFVGGDIYVAKQQSDPEKNALDVAIRQTEELIKDLEEQQDRENGVDVGFWRGFGRVAGDVRSWDRGMSNAKDAITMLNAERLVDKDATEGERAAYNDMMEAIYNKEQAEQAYGGNASFWNRAGVMTGHMPSFMLDFAMTGAGFKGLNMLSSGATKAATKALGKEVVDEMAKQGFKTYVKNNGAKGLGQYAADWTIKALGTTGDDLLVRAPLMTNTVQAGSTVADIVDRKLGGVTVNEDGTYDFSNNKTWSSAIWQGEANSIIENYSEMFGSHLDPVVTFGNMSKLANVVGAKRLGSVLAKADAGALSGVMGQTQKLFGKMGVSDYFGEVAEEYYGQLWRTMFNLDDAYQPLFDEQGNPVYKKDEQGNILLDEEGNPIQERVNNLSFNAPGNFHGDIWGGMALSMGLMGVGKHTLTGAQYLSMKHGVNKADSRAAELLGKEIWEPLRQTIDQTTNDEIGSLAERIVSDPDFTNDELAAVFTYMERSLNMRGFNLGALAQKRGGEGNQNAQSMDEHYIDGYNINSPQEMTDAKNMYDMQRQRVADALGEDVLADIDRDPEAAIGKLGEDEPTNRTVIEYLNAKMVYDGMNKRVADDADARIAESDALVDSHTHKKTGMVQGATMKDEDRRVYIVNGNVVPLQDGTGIDLDASDNSIIIRDAESGELEQVSPEVLLNVDAEIDPTAEKQAARDAIASEVRANAERMQNGVVGFAPGDVYTVLGEDGNTHQVEIVQDNGDNTVAANVDGEAVEAMAKEQIQNEVDAYNRQRVVLVADSAQGAEAADNAADAKPNYELNAHITMQTPEGVVTGNINQAENDDNLIEVQVNKPFGGKKTVDMYTREELDNMVVEVADENGNVIWSKPAENAEAVAEGTGEATALGRIPKDEKGEPMYESVDADTAWGALVELSKGNKETAKMIADSMVSQAEEVLKKKEKQPSLKGTPAQMAAAIDARNAELQAARASVEKWKEIAGVEEKRSQNSAAQETAQEIENLKPVEGENVRLSDEIDENGIQFVLNSEGNVVFGEIRSETGLPEAPILLSEGLITNPETNDGYGLVHIEARHGEQIRKAGYPSVVSFIEEVAKNYEVIREGINRNGHQTYMLQLKDKHNNTLMVELSTDGTYWNINTAGIFKTSYGRNRKEVYNRHTTAKQPTETVEASQNTEQSGTTVNPSMNAPTPSEGKGTDKSVTAEGTAEEISEKAQNATQSEQNELEKAEKERIDALVPTIEDVADGMQTADEFVAGLFGNGIRITPESFRKETGLGWEEQRRLVGIIAGKEKGGLTVEQAAETIVENYRAELAERGFSGDSMEMRDMVIDILSSGNPRAYAKQASARRAEQALHREMEAFDRYTQEAFHMSAEEYIMYEESMLPKYIEQYKDFDEQEYYSNFADEQSTQNEHDTTRESAEAGGSREILSEEQPSATPGEGTAGEGQQGGTLQGDVQGNAQEGLARAEAGQEGELASTGRLNQIREKVSLNLGDKYSLSSEQADNGELFYQGESGTTLAVIPDEIFDRMGISPVPFKLTESMGWHVYDHHKNETAFKNISDAIDFILSIINNVDHVRLGRDNSYIFSVENGRNKTGRRAVTIMINSKTGAFIGIKTSGYESIKNLKGRPLLWERGAETDPEDVASPTIATITPQQGDEDASRTKSQSNASSGYKDTDNPQNNTNKQGVISENAGNAKSGEQTGRTRFSTSTFEDAERIAREEQRRAPLRRTARAWEKILGVKVTLMERLEDVKDPVARREIEAAEKKGKKVPGWYSDTEGVFLYLPHVENENEVDKTCVHEIVSHKGLKELLGQEKFDELCSKVWGIMSPSARKKYRNYPNVHNELEAADEYIAHLSEKVELNASERSVWQKIMDFIAGLLGRKADNRSKAASIVGKETLSRKDIAELVRLSYAEYLQRNGNATEAVKEAVELGEAGEGQTMLREVDDPDVIAKLEASPKRRGFRNVVRNEDGTFSSPMAYWLQSTTGGAKTRVETAKFELGKWEEAEEHPELVDENGKIVLVKPDKGTIPVAYDPYIHNRLDPVNLQFKDAWKRNDLIYVETEVPTTDLESGYHADKALLPVGVHSWSNGDLMLSIYDKPIRFVPWDEVADAWAERLAGKDVHFDVVPPLMRSLLVERGVEIIPPHKGMGKDCRDAYAEWKNSVEKNGGVRFRFTEEEQGIIDEAKKNGTYMKAPNGQPTNLNEKQWAQVRTKAFKKWFGDWENDPANASKVVDENGEPMVVYHYSNNPNITIFNPFRRSTDLTKEEFERLENIKNAYNDGYRSLIRPFMGIWATPIRGEYADYGKYEYALFANIKNPRITNSVSPRLSGSKKDDGVFSYSGGILMEVSTTLPEKFKSATDNTGEFSKENNDIRFRILPNERLRKLEEGETCNIERVFTQQKMFNFSSGEKIESYEDVAYIFRSLEDEAVENAFVALVKNGKPTIVHLGMGTATQSTVDQQAVIVAVERIKPDAVYFVHNHPSGNLKASRQDAMLLDSMKKAYGDIVKDGIIINLRSGKYSVFNEEGIKIEEATPNAPEKVTAAKTYSFSKRVFDKDFNVEELMHVTGSDAADAYAREHGLVAALTSSQRLGERGKLSLLVISQGSKIVGNVFLNHTEVLPSNLGNISKEIAYYVSAMGGQAGILYGRFGINETRHLGGAVNRASAGSVRMLDAISMTEFGGYVSALDEGVMEETPSYGEGETRFRVTDDIEDANARFNEELDAFEEGTLKGDLHLGEPGILLKHLGLNATEMYITPKTLKNHMEKHGLKVADIKNLPKAMQEPLMVYEWGDKAKSLIVITQIPRGEQRITAAIKIERGGRRLEVNEIASVHGKEAERFMSDMINAKKGGLKDALKYVDKNKALEWLGLVPPKGTASLTAQELDVAKVIKDFQNPSVGGGIRFRSVDKLRERYDKLVRLPNKIGSVKWHENLPYRLREAYQDSMLSLKILQDVILEETGNGMTSGENAYMAENQMSSKNKAEAEMYERDFFKPMMEEVKNLLSAGATYDEVQKYLFAKHGLERNMEMYKKNKQEAIDKWIEERTEQLVNNGMSQADARAQAQQDIALYPSMSDSELDKQYRRDYSGLTALTEKDNVADAEAEATKMVSDFEGRFDTADLWDKINAATRETLRKSYDSGMMDKATYNKILGMYHYYIPLRGWDADVAEKEYEYLSDRSLNLSPVLVKTKGRTSLADDPIATIGFMAEGAIVQGNRNLMKQRFMNFVLNNPTSLVSVSKQWYVEQADGTWVPDNPQIPADATGDQVAAIVEQHEQKMLSLGKKAKTKRAGLKLDLHATKQEGQEHMVRVKRGGKEYCLYINGSPRAAQALNGMTNPDASNSSLYKAASAVKNFMARMFTSQNPAFVVSNLSRDLIWAGTAVAVRENKDYVARYTKNVGKAFKNATLPRLLRKYQNGTLDMNVEEERLFMEFIKHGGETGFTQITSVEDYKKDIKRFVKEVQKGKSLPKKAWDGFFDTVEFLNRSAEDTTRFMVYMTSRQMGRDVATSVSDAKEITVNFNKKGSGGLGASVMNFCYIFFNAAIQSLSGFGKMMAEHPKRTLAGLTAYASAGVIVPAMSIALQALTGDDDDESYWDLPEWIRRNNLVLYVPFTDSGFITIPLPHELRPFYAMGEIALSAMCGREDVEDGLRKVAMNFAEMLPLDFTGNGGNLAVNLTPTIAQPVAQIIANKYYTGKPIYKKHEWNKRDPEWTKAYKGTSPWIVEGTKWLNRLSGGDDVKSGAVDWNPALIEHVLESYTGGAGKTFNRTMKTFQMMWDEDMRQWRNVPVISSFVQSGDERIQGSDVNNRYYEAYDEFEDTKRLLSGYKEKKKKNKPGTAGYVEYARKLDELMNSDEYKRYKVFKGRQKAIKKVSDKLKETDDRDRIDSLNTRLMQLKEEMLEELEKADDSPKP